MSVEAKRIGFLMFGLLAPLFFSKPPFCPGCRCAMSDYTARAGVYFMSPQNMSNSPENLLLQPLLGRSATTGIG